MSVLREGTRARWLTITAGTAIVFALALAAWAGLDLAAANDSHGDDGGSACANPVDVSLVFDHTGSMDDVDGKIEGAVDAGIEFVDFFAGGPGPDLSPHEMALTGFTEGIAATEVTLGSDAGAIRDVLDDYGDDSSGGDDTNGFTHIGRALQLGQLQLEPPPDPDAEPDLNDYLVLLSDGAANRPADIDQLGAENDFYIDVNDNGVVDSGDDLSLDYPGGDSSPDLVIIDGLLQVASDAERRQALNADDSSEDPLTDDDLSNADDWNADGGLGYNFAVINGALFLDADGDGVFDEDGVNFQPGHGDELAVQRDGAVWAGSSTYSGDGSDVYALYWATQVKQNTDTNLIIIGYQIGDEQDTELLQLMASEDGYYPSDIFDVSEVFGRIAGSICGVSVDKSADEEVSKIGDDVHYHIVVSNPFDITVYKQSIVDSILGDLTDNSNAYIDDSDCGDSLAPGEDCEITLTYTVQPDDPDPLVNEVDVIYNSESDFSGTELGSSDSVSIALFEPAVSVDKDGPDTVQVGETITYEFTITNESSSDSPDLVLDGVTDVGDGWAGLGDLTATASANDCDTLAPGESCDFSVQIAAPAGPSPLDNTVTVHYHPDGFPNDITDDDSHSSDLLGASVAVEKSGTTVSKAGDPIVYDFTITNTSTEVTPDLELVSVTDLGDGWDGLGDLTDLALANDCGSLAAGESCQFSVEITAPEGPDPLNNTVTVVFNPEGLQSEITNSDSHSVDLFQPDFTIDKDGPDAAHQNDEVTFSFTITNTSSDDSPALNLVSISDDKVGDLLADASAAGCDALEPGDSCSFEIGHVIPSEASDPYDNVVTAVYQVDGFPNQLERSDDHSLDVLHPNMIVFKECTSLVQPGGIINVQASVQNSGDTDLFHLTVTDSHAGPLTYVSGDTGDDGVLAVDEVWLYTGSHVAPLVGIDVTDTVTVEALDILERAGSDQDFCLTQIDQPPSVEVDKTVDGSDPGNAFSDDETTDVGSTVTYRVIIDNDSPEPVTITSLLDDIYPGAICRDFRGEDVVGQTLGADDGDGPGATNGGPDEIVCFFEAEAPSDPDVVVTDTVTVVVEDGQENEAEDSDDATVRTAPPDDVPPVIEIDKTVDGSDPGDDFTDDETTTVDSTVTYRVVIDNDSDEPVIITSLLDDIYPGAVCLDADGVDVVGQTLSADDGDGPGSMNGGPDEISCTFEEQAPSENGAVVTDTVTVTVEDEGGNGSDSSDEATIRTSAESVLSQPPAGPVGLPSTGVAAVDENGGLLLLAVLGAGLAGIGAWLVRNGGRRRGSSR